MIKQGVDSRFEPSFGLRNRAARAAWAMCYNLVFRFTPRPAHALRALMLRAFGARLGKACHVYPRARIWAPWNLVMLDNACLADDVICYTMARITLGKNVIVSQGAHLCAGTHDYEDPSFQLYASPITIGDSAWICAEAFVGPGVNIGEGAVLGARAVAIKDVPAWMVCAGNPCRPLKQRKIRSETA